MYTNQRGKICWQGFGVPGKTTVRAMPLGFLPRSQDWRLIGCGADHPQSSRRLVSTDRFAPIGHDAEGKSCLSPVIFYLVIFGGGTTVRRPLLLATVLFTAMWSLLICFIWSFPTKMTTKSKKYFQYGHSYFILIARFQSKQDNLLTRGIEWKFSKMRCSGLWPW